MMTLSCSHSVVGRPFGWKSMFILQSTRNLCSCRTSTTCWHWYSQKRLRLRLNLLLPQFCNPTQPISAIQIRERRSKETYLHKYLPWPVIRDVLRSLLFFLHLEHGWHHNRWWLIIDVQWLVLFFLVTEYRNDSISRASSLGVIGKTH